MNKKIEMRLKAQQVEQEQVTLSLALGLKPNVLAPEFFSV